MLKVIAGGRDGYAGGKDTLKRRMAEPYGPDFEHQFPLQVDKPARTDLLTSAHEDDA